VKVLKAVLLAVLLSFVVGFTIGTVIRMRLERSVVYIGSAIAPHPLDIGDSGAPIFNPRHHEEQIG
jgi:hypothetical protein